MKEMIFPLIFITICVTVAKSNAGSIPGHQPMFHAGIGEMFQSLAIGIFNELQGHNTSVGGDLLSKIMLLNGGMQQLLAMVNNTSYQVFQTFLPIIRIILVKGQPHFNKIKFKDHELQKRFAWTSENIKSFHDLHSDIKNQLKKLEEICKFHNVEIK